MQEYDARSAVAKDAGRMAALLNYDVIRGTIGGYYSIVNRAMCAVQDGNV